jgi:hypothetical protein
MSLLIDNPETERNVLALAAATGEPIAEAVNKAALARLQQTKSRANAIHDLLSHVDALPRTNRAMLAEEVDYDEDGLPL